MKLETLGKKLISRENITDIISRHKEKKQRIVFTNGCFDIIHRGHVEYLAQAADLGDILILGLNTDVSVRNLKGKNRPVNDEFSRAIVLAAFEFIDYIVFFHEDTPYNLITLILPDFLVKGGDYKTTDIVGYDIVTQNGGQVVTIPLVEGFSTTSIMNRMSK